MNEQPAGLTQKMQAQLGMIQHAIAFLLSLEHRCEPLSLYWFSFFNQGMRMLHLPVRDFLADPAKHSQVDFSEDHSSQNLLTIFPVLERLKVLLEKPEFSDSSWNMIVKKEIKILYFFTHYHNAGLDNMFRLEERRRIRFDGSFTIFSVDREPLRVSGSYVQSGDMFIIRSQDSSGNALPYSARTVRIIVNDTGEILWANFNSFS